MTIREYCHWLGVAFFCANVQEFASAANIEGLSVTNPLRAAAVSPIVVDRVLKIQLTKDQTIVVEPWHAYLPQEFGSQKISGGRRMNPAGPIDFLSMSRPSELLPWLLIGRGTRAGTKVLGKWKLQLDQQQWSVSNGSIRKVLEESAHIGKPVLIIDHRDKWCVYLLDSHMQHNVESEAQAMWVAQRLQGSRGRCVVK